MQGKGLLAARSQRCSLSQPRGSAGADNARYNRSLAAYLLFLSFLSAGSALLFPLFRRFWLSLSPLEGALDFRDCIWLESFWFFHSKLRPKSSESLKWSLQITLLLLGPSHFARVSFTREVHTFLIFSSFGKLCRLTPSFVVLLQPATMHLVGIFANFFKFCEKITWFGMKMQPKHVLCNMTVYGNNLQSFCRWRQQADVSIMQVLE